MADLYDTTKQNISSHIKNIFDEEELTVNSTVKEFLTIQKGENRKVERNRRWATERLKEYMIKVFTMDDDRFKGNGWGNYWKGLLIGSGTISHDKATKKAITEYRKYQVKTISPVEKEYLETLKIINNKIDKVSNNE